jgi:hypothetical protein
MVQTIKSRYKSLYVDQVHTPVQFHLFMAISRDALRVHAKPDRFVFL